MSHRIPRLTTIALTLAALAEEATAMGEVRLAQHLVVAMGEAQDRANAIASGFGANP